MVVNPFPRWLAEVAKDAIIVRPDDIDAEARGNSRSLALSPEQASAISIADVEAFAAKVAESRRAWLTTRDVGPMLLYWWHDTPAGQLRFSLVSVSHGRLPFGCQVEPATSLAAIAADWLASPHLAGIPWGETRALASNEAPSEPSPPVLPVWSGVLSRND